MPSRRGQSGGGGEPLSGARFAVHIGGAELAVGRCGPPTLAADLASVASRPVPRETNRVTWVGKPARSTLVLARAVDGDRTLYDWRRAALSDDQRTSDAATRDVEIALLDATGGKAVVTYRLSSAWPVRWSGPLLDAQVPAVAWEELEVVYLDVRIV